MCHHQSNIDCPRHGSKYYCCINLQKDSVPTDEKDKSRDFIRENLSFIRSNAAFGQQLVLTPRTNGLETGRFHDDVDGVLNKETVGLIDGFCVPKVDRV